MDLFLVQHAHAKREEEDPERPLTEQGWADIRRVARYAAEHLAIKVDRVLHSGKTRARQTAEVLAEAVTAVSEVQAAENLDPLSDPHVWRENLTHVEEDLMLVGHLPHMSKLASLLLCGDETKPVIAFETGGILCLGRADNGDWSVRWMVTPSTV